MCINALKIILLNCASGRYSRPRKRRRSATLDDSSDNISYMCITDDDHGTYLTPADNDQREEAPILT